MSGQSEADVTTGQDTRDEGAIMTPGMQPREVDDIEATLRQLVADGAEIQDHAKDVGGGKLLATARDADDNLFDLIRSP